MNSNYFYSNIVQTSKNKSFLEEMQSIAESIKQQVYVLSGPLIDGKYQYNDDSLIILLSSKKKIAFVTTIIRKSKFPQNPKRSVRFSGKRTKRSVQKRKARNTQKAETKVL